MIPITPIHSTLTGSTAVQKQGVADLKKVPTVKCAIDRECLRQFARSRTEAALPAPTSACGHRLAASRRFERANQHKAVRASAFHEKIQQPVNAIVQVNVQRSWRVSFNKLSRATSEKRVTCLIAMFRISLRFDNPPRSLPQTSSHPISDCAQVADRSQRMVGRLPSLSVQRSAFSVQRSAGAVRTSVTLLGQDIGNTVTV